MKWAIRCSTAGEMYHCDVRVTKSRELAEVVRAWMLRQYGWKPHTNVEIREVPDNEDVTFYNGWDWVPAPEW